MLPFLPFDPKKPLLSFRLKCPHAWRRVHIFFVDDPFIYLRPKHAPEDWLGALFYFGVLGKGLKEHIVRDLEDRHFWRVLHLPDPNIGEKRMWRVLWRPDYGYVIPIEHDEDLKGAFFWPQKTQHNMNLWRTPTPVFYEHFECEWNNPDSDVREALLWCDLPVEERLWRSVKWQIGGREELKSVAKAACTAETEWGGGSGHELTLSIDANKTPKGREKHKATIRAAVLAEKWLHPPDHRLPRIFARLQERNQGSFDEPNGHRNAWHLPWHAVEPSRRHWAGARIQFRIEPPTSHERLEAALFLRDWLGQNAPDLLADWFPT